jgi:glutamate/tyrosine decarboxylase-like PLP-dependent enzyme
MLPNTDVAMNCKMIHGLSHGVQFLRLGKEGYTKIMMNLGQVARRLQKGIEDTGTAFDLACSCVQCALVWSICVVLCAVV